MRDKTEGNSSGGWCPGQQGSGRLTSPMAGDGSGQMGQDIELLKVARLGDRQETCSSQLAVGTAIAKAGFSPLHTRSKRSFGAVVRRLYSFVVHKSEQRLDVVEQGRGKIADIAMGTV